MHRRDSTAPRGRPAGFIAALALLAVTATTLSAASGHDAKAGDHPLFTYTLQPPGTAAAYDEAVAVSTVQGLINRAGPRLYVLSPKNPRPDYWLDLFARDGGWLAGRQRVALPDLDALVKQAGQGLKGAVIWDPAVPATVNVATTIAGVRDGIVLSPAQADRYLKGWGLPVLEDLRGRFTGAETGSRKNDAYRWAIREYLAKGLCSTRLLCLFHDSFGTREQGEIGYAITRDWAVHHRSFVFDLSPWGDERPGDDPNQRLGLDLETYRIVLDEVRRQAAGRHLTELTGFFNFSKYSHVPGHESAHEPVPTEWETVWLITPYGLYQNTVSDNCYNQSLHHQAPRQPLRQGRTAEPRKIGQKTYLCIFMADYDSAGVLYDSLPQHWDDPNRGKLPLAWGINPNLLDTYPDVIAHIYRTLTPADTITADAGAAGYFNPSRLSPGQFPLFVRHNQAYFHEADLDIAPMVLDWAVPSAAVKDAFQQFAPNGMGALLWDMHANTGPQFEPHVWKGMPVIHLLNDANEFPGPEKSADIVAQGISDRGGEVSGFYMFRIVWQSPTQIIAMLDALHRRHPEIDFEVLDIHTFFALAKEHLQAREKASLPKP